MDPRVGNLKYYIARKSTKNKKMQIERYDALEKQKRGNITKKENHRVIVMWEEEYMEKGAVNPTKKKLLKSMWNKHVEVA